MHGGAENPTEEEDDDDCFPRALFELKQLFVPEIVRAGVDTADERPALD